MKPINAQSASDSGSSDDVIYLGGDEPETCRWCGMRTIFDELADGTQQHECPACKACYLVTFD